MNDLNYCDLYVMKRWYTLIYFDYTWGSYKLNVLNNRTNETL